LGDESQGGTFSQAAGGYLERRAEKLLNFSQDDRARGQ
jgi:hypothetical protein